MGMSEFTHVSRRVLVYVAALELNCASPDGDTTTLQNTGEHEHPSEAMGI